MSERNELDAADASVSRPHGAGPFLREARQAAGLGLEEAAARVRMPARVVEALEQEQWDRLGAPVFLRGQLRSYARLLKVDVEPFIVEAQLERVRPAALVSRAHTPRYQRVMESLAKRAVYVVLTAAIAVPVWVATQWDAGDLAAQRTASLDVAASSGERESAVSGMGARADAAPATVVASLSPLPRPAGGGLLLRTRADSWIEVQDRAGATIERGLLKSGEVRAFRKGAVARVVLGNAAAVEVQHGGSTVDLQPFQRANVARFAVSSDGSLVPIAD